MLLPGDATPSCSISRVCWLSHLQVSSGQGAKQSTWMSPQSKATHCPHILVLLSPSIQPFQSPGLWQSQAELRGFSQSSGCPAHPIPTASAPVPVVGATAPAVLVPWDEQGDVGGQWEEGCWECKMVGAGEAKEREKVGA